MPLMVRGRKFYYTWEAAELCGVTPQTIRNWIRAGRFRGVLELLPAPGAVSYLFLIPAREVHRRS